ncbi:DUF1330 domain-containing protein [Pseudomonas sp. M30-35]|uniref:DUF1330 domain-containing protein n=1 Tax=Pseudomonas sp. M30-35 TaxID=1981174 RepID=UPI000B3CAF18|nr:DUF1330 domain-containing protein [Pseudomonas sp. M30-35]ARU86533.1 DUF1330 domain-containing protein [Pseudomonas sp. M30-35]
MPSLNPSREQLAEFAERMPDNTPILMLNLLRFNAQASYPEGSEHTPCTGQQAYATYSKTALKKVQGVGGSVELLANAHVALIAPSDEQWDQMLLVRYPSKQAFLSMINDPQYQAVTVHRTAALSDSRLIGTTAVTD